MLQENVFRLDLLNPPGFVSLFCLEINMHVKAHMPPNVRRLPRHIAPPRCVQTRLGEGDSSATERRPGQKNWKGCGDAASAEPCTCPAGCVRRHEAFTDTRTPLPSGRLHTDGLSSYFRRLHYSWAQTYAGKALVSGLHTCARHWETATWAQTGAIRNILLYKNQTNPSMNLVASAFLLF